MHIMKYPVKLLVRVALAVTLLQSLAEGRHDMCRALCWPHGV